jgi:large subunit ribosomal protein L6
MSLIGNTIITIPTGVTLTQTGDVITVVGKKGELTVRVEAGIAVDLAENTIKVNRTNDENQTKAFHGLVRSLLNNAVNGVTTGYRKTLQLVGTGYRVAARGQGLTLTLGFSHPVLVEPVKCITFTLEGNDTIHNDGIDRQLVGQVAADIRKVRRPEPYKGKGIRYHDEVVRRKAGKTAA